MDAHLLIWVLFTFVLGCIVGSFLNVCIYRLPRDRSVFHPTFSYCPCCHHGIAWYDNIPLVSYLALDAQCRHCGSAISPRYPGVELLTGVLFALCFYVLRARGEAMGVVVVYCLLTGALIVSSFIDLELRIIPDSVTLGGALAAPVLCALFPEVHQNPEGVQLGRHLFLFGTPAFGALAACGMGMLIGSLLTWGTGVMGRAIFRKEAMGLGDVKLMAMIGGIMGWKQALIVFFVAPIFGAVVGIIVLLRTRDHHIPYGPFLSIATVVVMLWGDLIIKALGLV